METHQLRNSAGAIRSTVPEGARIAFVSGNFNILHPGHLRLLKFASDLADILVVGVTPDSTQGVTVPGEMRIESVRALTIVRHAVMLEGDVAGFISRLKPDFVVKGKEFASQHNPEAAVVSQYGGKLVFSSGNVQFASTELLRKEFVDSAPPLLRSADGFPERHGLGAGDLRTLIDKMARMRVVVVGDTIVDEYITCDPLGMSQEDPTIVVSPLATSTFVGGAGVVAAHARNLGADVHFLTVLGVDETAHFAEANIRSYGIELHALRDETRPTTRKQRYRALNKTLIRVNHLRQHAISQQLSEQLLNRIAAVLPSADLLMFSDFNYGCLPQDLVNKVTAMAREYGVMMAADSQASSQVSDISRFKGTALVTPTEREARLALRDMDSGLTVVAIALREAASAENVIITLGEDGVLVHARDSRGEYITDRLPALNSAPKDVAGAGDSLFAATSMGLCASGNIWLSSYLGEVVAAIQVSGVGNAPLEIADLLQEIAGMDSY